MKKNLYSIVLVSLLAGTAGASQPAFDARWHRNQLAVAALAVIVSNPIAAGLTAATKKNNVKPAKKYTAWDRCKTFAAVATDSKSWVAPYHAFWYVLNPGDKETKTRGQLFSQFIKNHKTFSVATAALLVDAAVVTGLWLKYKNDFAEWEKSAEGQAAKLKKELETEIRDLWKKLGNASDVALKAATDELKTQKAALEASLTKLQKFWTGLKKRAADYASAAHEIVDRPDFSDGDTYFELHLDGTEDAAVLVPAATDDTHYRFLKISSPHVEQNHVLFRKKQRGAKWQKLSDEETKLFVSQVGNGQIKPYKGV